MNKISVVSTSADTNAQLHSHENFKRFYSLSLPVSSMETTHDHIVTTVQQLCPLFQVEQRCQLAQSALKFNFFLQCSFH